jgi:Na+/glutamate symporter
MKKLFALALLGMVSWALAGTPVQASEVSKPGTTLVKHKKKHKKHKKHKTT